MKVPVLRIQSVIFLYVEGYSVPMIMTGSNIVQCGKLKELDREDV